MSLEVTVVDGVSTSPNMDCWRMIYNATDKKVSELFQSVGVTRTKSSLYCDTTKQACLDFATANSLKVSGRLLGDDTD